ncbi:MAG: extensin family protein [Sphingobium sp.]
MRFLLALLLIGAIATAAALGIRDYGRRHPQDVPWTSLNLSDPIGRFTGRKLSALTSEPRQCLALLRRADVRFTPLPDRAEGQCGYRDGVRLRAGGAMQVGWRPADLGVACPVAAALDLWNRDVVQPAAKRHLGTTVARIETFGSYNCRRLYGRGSGDWSEHATADAVDIAGFRLTDGRRITIQSDWTGQPSRTAFLREVRDGACSLFSTVLSPDYNRAHADHLHLDQAERGATGWRACR